MMKPMVDDLMVQQQLKAPHKRWKHMVGVMCLNLTYRKHVKIVFPRRKHIRPVAQHVLGQGLRWN